MTGKLVVVPTPIGNLGDITLRALDALRAADVVCAEDTRVTGRLLAALGMEGKHLERLDENLLGQRAEAVVQRVLAGQVVAYCSDAGMPGVSDPGLRLVAAARAVDAPVEILPGPTAVATAYVASGTDSAAFYFGGFFPRKDKARRDLLASLKRLDAALVFYESPNRLLASLRAIAEVFPLRHVTVCRELTKLHEEVTRAPAAEVLADYESRDSVKGEVVVVIDAPSAAEHDADATASSADAAGRAAQLAAAGERPKAIAKQLAAEFGLPRNQAYDLALASARRI